MPPAPAAPATADTRLVAGPSRPLFSGPAWWCLLGLAWLTLALGLAMAGLGVQLLLLGGSAYYAWAGGALAVAALLALRRRVAPGAALLGATVLATLLWSLWEIQAKGWQPLWGVDLAARAGVLTGLWAALAGAWWLVRRRVPRAARPRGGGGLAALALGTVLVGLVVLQAQPIQPAAGGAAPAPAASPVQAHPPEQWTAFGGSHLGQRFSAAAQITPHNVAALEQVWEFRSGDLAPNERVFYAFQNTPLKVGNSLFVCTPSSQVYALDPASGRPQWHFDPQVPALAMEPLFSATCRAVGYHQAADATAQTRCGRRVLVATADGRLIALDAGDGRPCAGFGAGGTLDLTRHMGNQVPGFSSSTSGPAVVGDLVIVGQQVSDNQRRDAPGGVVRAFDVASGALRWAWDARRADDAQAPLPPGELWPRGTPNVWNVISADEGLGLVYLGTGNSAADQFGGSRDPAEDAYTAAVVAVELASGRTRWRFNTMNHDLWDYDLGAQPLLTDLEIDGRSRRVVVQGTKTGAIFVLDAATGEPLTRVAQRPVPAGDIPGERYAPTQPLAPGYPNFSGLPGAEPEVLSEASAFGLTPIDALLCRIDFRRMRYRGPFTPPNAEPGGVLLMPGIVGGINWGGKALNPATQTLITNHSRLPNRVTMVPRAQVTDQALGDGGARADQDVAPQAGTPYGVKRPNWMSVLQVPCIAPPWGFLSATDLRSGRLLWTQPLGTGFDVGPLGVPTRLKLTLGTPNLGGAVNTAGGLTFIGAAQDNFLRAFDTHSGALLWEGRLPAGPQASAMSYLHEGRQYVVIAAGGHARFQTTPGDSVLAFALPH